MGGRGVATVRTGEVHGRGEGGAGGGNWAQGAVCKGLVMRAQRGALRSK